MMDKTCYPNPKLAVFFGGSIIGTATFFLLYGTQHILDPTNVAWLMTSGDRATSFLGWQFFRNETWHWPLGATWSYGMGSGGSIVFSDSIPLMAFLFKIFSRFLPSSFQYVGIWLLLSFALLGGFGWLLFTKFTKNIFIQCCSTTIITFSPIMIKCSWGHFALSAHWTILAAIFLYYYHKKTIFYWMAWNTLLVICTLVHFYLFGMVFIIWLACIYKNVINNESTPKEIFATIITTTLIVSISMWQAGYFTGNGGVGVSGFGTYRMNLCALFDSNGLFSYLLPDIPTTNEEWEGFNYLGSGVIFLMVSGALAYLSNKCPYVEFINRQKIITPLITACIFLTIFALSNKVYLSTWEIITLPLPETIDKLCNIFRGSGRFFWPVYYLIVIFTILFSLSNFRTMVAPTMLGIALLLQVGDSPLIISKIKRIFDGGANKNWENPLTDPMWEQFAKRYKKIRTVMPINNGQNWLPLGYYAATHGMAINSGYFARTNNKELTKEQNVTKEAIANKNFSPDSLYIFNDIDLYRNVSNRLHEKELHGIFNGFPVIAPNWF